MSLPRNLSSHEREARQNFGKYEQVQKHPDHIEYWMHLQECLRLPAYCMQCLHIMTSVASGDLSRLTHTVLFQKLSKTAIEIRITSDLKTTYCKYSVLYGKTRVKYTTQRRPLSGNTVFSSIFYESDHFYRALPCKTRISGIC